MAVLPRPAAALRPPDRFYYRKPPPDVPPDPIAALPCKSCRDIGRTSRPGCRECARALRNAKAKATEGQPRIAVRPVRLDMRRVASSTETVEKNQPTREELCRNRVLSGRVEAKEQSMQSAEALVAGRPQDWVRHQPQHGRLVPLCIGDVLLPDDGRPWDSEEAATVTAVTELKVHVHWSSDGSVGTILRKSIRVPVIRAANASQIPTATSTGRCRGPDELRRTQQKLAMPHVSFLTTCDELGPTHPRAQSHWSQQPLISHLRTSTRKSRTPRVPSSIIGAKPAVFQNHKRSGPQNTASTYQGATIDFSASFSQRASATPNDVGRWTATVDGALERFQQSAVEPPQVSASFVHMDSLSARNAAAGTAAWQSAGATQQAGPLRWEEARGTPTWAQHSPRHQIPTVARPQSSSNSLNSWDSGYGKVYSGR